MRNRGGAQISCAINTPKWIVNRMTTTESIVASAATVSFCASVSSVSNMIFGAGGDSASVPRENVLKKRKRRVSIKLTKQSPVKTDRVVSVLTVVSLK